MQSLWWHQVDYDLSESGVSPLSIAELLDGTELGDPATFAETKLGYPLSEGSELTRERIAQWYPGATPANVTVVNGGSEANLLTLFTLLGRRDRLAFEVPNYMQGWGLGRFFGRHRHVPAEAPRGAAGRWTRTSWSAPWARIPRS